MVKQKYRAYEATQSFAENKNRIVTTVLTAYESSPALLTLSTNASSTTIDAALKSCMIINRGLLDSFQEN